jgi:hypothetical protein
MSGLLARSHSFAEGTPRSPASTFRVALRAIAARFLLLSVLGAGACQCGTPPPPPSSSTIGQLTAKKIEGGFELDLANLDRPVRALQVDVKLAGGVHATKAEAIGGSDVLEAGLDQPKDDFTVVVSDTRRLNVPEGGVVKVTTDKAPSTITLSRALAVDDGGARRQILVVAQ